jgi:hypothetical protein
MLLLLPIPALRHLVDGRPHGLQAVRHIPLPLVEVQHLAVQDHAGDLQHSAARWCGVGHLVRDA